MAVHTKLTQNEIIAFLKNYSIGELVTFKEILDGIDNSNFIIETTQDKFILTIFENRISQEQLPFFMDLKLHLAQHQICCPKPIANNAGQLISLAKGKSAAIVSFLNGRSLKPEESGLYESITTIHCGQVGRVLALLHNAVADFTSYRANDLGVDGWRHLFNKIADRIDNYQPNLQLEIAEYIDFLEKNWRSDLSSGVVHVDLFPDNVFFDQNNNLSGVIDFYFAAHDLFIYDIAVVINAWCFDKNNQFDQKKYLAILDGYRHVKAISEPELEFLKVALMGASMRFLLTRLNDLFFTPPDSLVKIKNPQEYLEKIRFFSKMDKIS